MCLIIKNEEIKGIIDAIDKEEVKAMDIHEKMFYITTLMEVKKDTDNNHSNFKYSSLTAIKLALNPLALKFRVLFKFDNFKSRYDDKGKKIMDGTIIGINIDKKDDNYSLSLELPHKILTSGGMTETESTGATITYLERYLYRTMLNIADGDDDPDNFVGKDTKGKTSNNKNKGISKEDFQKEMGKEHIDVQDYVFEGLTDKYNNKITIKNCIYLGWKDLKKAQERLEEMRKKPDVTNTNHTTETTTDGVFKPLTAQQKIRIENLISFTKSNKTEMLKYYRVEKIEDLSEKLAGELLVTLTKRETKLKNKVV